MLLKFRSFAPSKKQVKTEMRRWNLFNHFSWTRCCLADEKSFLKLDLDMGLAKISLRMHLTDHVTVENWGSNELIIFCFLYEYFLLLVSSLLHLHEYNYSFHITDINKRIIIIFIFDPLSHGCIFMKCQTKKPRENIFYFWFTRIIPKWKKLNNNVSSTNTKYAICANSFILSLCVRRMIIMMVPKSLWIFEQSLVWQM